MITATMAIRLEWLVPQGDKWACKYQGKDGKWLSIQPDGTPDFRAVVSASSLGVWELGDVSGGKWVLTDTNQYPTGCYAVLIIG